jgi:hypothetical protein
MGTNYTNPNELAKLVGDFDLWRAKEHGLRATELSAQQRRVDGVASLRGHLPDNDPIFGQQPATVAQKAATSMSRQSAYARLSAGGSRDGAPAEHLADWDRTVSLLG